MWSFAFLSYLVEKVGHVGLSIIFVLIRDSFLIQQNKCFGNVVK